MRLVLNIIHSSLSLAIIYGSYVITTEYLTLQYNAIGFLAYVLIFLLNIISSVLAPFIVYYILGVKWTLVVGASTYLCWLALFNSGNSEAIIAGAILIGLGAGLVRSQQNVYILSLDLPSDNALYIGIYNAIFGINGIIGSGFSIMILLFGLTLKTLIWILCGISCVAFIFLLFIKPVTLNETHEISLKLYWYILKDYKLMLLIPIVLYLSANIVFTYEVVPLFINNKLHIVITFLIYGIIYCSITYILGCIITKVDPILIFIFHIICSFITCISFIMFNIFSVSSPYYIILGSINGINDSIINYMVVYLLAKHFSSKVVYSICRSYTCLFSAIFSGIYQFINIYQIIIMINIFLLISVLFYIYFKYKIDMIKDEIFLDL